MINIVFFVGNISSRGGTERVTSLIVNGLSSYYNIHVLGLAGSREDLFFPLNRSIKVDTLLQDQTKGINKLVSSIQKIRQFNKANAIQVFISVESMLAIYSTPALVGSNIKHVVWEHFNFNVDLGKRARKVARQLALTFADHVITLTERDVDYWKAGAAFRKANVLCIPNPAVSKGNNSKYDISSNVVISVGRLTHQKGFDLLIDAWKKISLSEKTGWKLKIIGSGPEREALSKQINNNNLSKFIELVPETTDVHQFYEHAGIYCLSSRFEGLPMVLLEALTARLPIVAFDCDTGPSEIINHGYNGLLVEPGNTYELHLSLLKLIKSPDIRLRMSNESSRTLDKFNIENILLAWKSILGQPG